MSQEPKFATITIGTELPEHQRRVTQADFDLMAVASLDYNPVHTNPQWARRAKVFGIESTVAHGMMTMTFQTSLICGWVSSVGGQIRQMESKFTRPVQPGDTITSRGEVIEIHYLDRNHGFVTIALTSVNQRGETVAAGRADVTLP